MDRNILIIKIVSLRETNRRDKDFHDFIQCALQSDSFSIGTQLCDQIKFRCPFAQYQQFSQKTYCPDAQISA